MKLYKSLIYTALILFITASCVNDLDVNPIDPDQQTSADVYQTTQDYKEGLAKLYASYALSGQQGPAGQPDIAGIDEGESNYLRQFWSLQELTTDEAIIAWNDRTIKELHYHTWSPTDDFIAAAYSRIMYTVAISNEFIRASSGSADTEIQRFNAEARFIRALSYFHGLDMFGNIPFVTEADLPGPFFPDQISRADLFTYVEGELLAIESELGEPGTEYGRADKAVAWMLLAKLYLNAEVYIQQDKYTEALSNIEKVINSGAYSLATEYLQNTTSDNHTSPEMIFTVNCDGEYTRSYGAMTFVINAATGGTIPTDLVGVGGWGGTRTTKALVEKFGDISTTTDTRAQLFWTDGQNLEINDVGAFTDGYAVVKFRNRLFDGSPSVSGHPEFVDTDFPIFRLADAYLMYAEAYLRGGGGSATLALQYVNDIRDRAGASTISGAQLTLPFIIDERGRELFWEGHRRTDLIRFGLFTGGDYLWPWKGNVKDGRSTESFRNLFPIPANDRGANPNLKQNPGY